MTHISHVKATSRDEPTPGCSCNNAVYDKALMKDLPVAAEQFNTVQININNRKSWLFNMTPAHQTVWQFDTYLQCKIVITVRDHIW